MITSAQLRALQSLCGKIFGGEADPRAARLSWAGAQLSREVASFKELSGFEATQLIELLKTNLGQQLAPRRRRTRTREAAVAGRRNAVVSVEILASAEDRSAVDELRRRAGMTEEQFANWLGSSRMSPTRGRRELRTVADCNRAEWALKAMLRRAG